MSLLHGIIPPVPTILTPDFHFDRTGQARLLDRLIASGVNGVLMLGSGGEFCHLSAEMRCEVAEFAISHVAGRVPVLVGIGAPGTLETIDLGRHAQKAGATAVLVVNPYYVHLSERNLRLHYEQVAHALDLPVMIYNFPALTGQDMSAETVTALTRACENIVGMKDTVPEIAHTRQILLEVRQARPDFMVFPGFDEQILTGLALGVDGAIPAISNFAPQIVCGLYAAWQAGDFPKAVAMHRAIAALAPIYDIETPFFAVIKEAIRLTGLDISTAVMPPARPLSPEARAQVSQILKAAHLL